MKKKILSLALAICLILPCMFMLSACGNKSKSGDDSPPVTDSRVWYDIGNYKMAFEGVENTGSSIRIYVEVKNPKSYDLTLSGDAFVLKWYGNMGGSEPISIAIKNAYNNWVDYWSLDFSPNSSALLKITFSASSTSSNGIYNLEYLGEKIAELTSTNINVMINN